MFFYVMGDKNWRSKNNFSEAHSNLAIATALTYPSSPCTVRINKPVVMWHERFFDIGGRYAQFAEMPSPIEFNRRLRQQLYLLN